MASMTPQEAIKKINQKGVLLVFPIKNRTDVPSLWHEFFPRTKMRWEWDEGADNRVGRLWVLMKKISNIQDVVYSKWFQGRATFFSRELFTALLCLSLKNAIEDAEVPYTSRLLLEALEESSPLSTKELKAATELQGKDNASAYDRGMKWLFARFQIVGYGEVDDGAFPSLAVGATKLLFEEIWTEAHEMDEEEAQKIADQFLPQDSPFRKFFEKLF